MAKQIHVKDYGDIDQNLRKKELAIKYIFKLVDSVFCLFLSIN